MPKYLQALLKISGYDNEISFRKLDNAHIKELEEFARTELTKLVLNDDDVAVCFGIFSKNPECFVIMPGDKELIKESVNLLKCPLYSAPESKKKKGCKIYYGSFNFTGNYN